MTETTNYSNKIPGKQDTMEIYPATNAVTVIDQSMKPNTEYARAVLSVASC